MKRLLDYIFIYIPALLIVTSISWVLVYRWMPVKWTPLMMKRAIENAGSENYCNRQNWVDKEQISPILIEAVLITEDQSSGVRT